MVDTVDLDSIAARERRTRHDVKARIEEFDDLAGHQHVHKGMTSRDLTENVEQLQIRDSLRLVADKTVAVLAAARAPAPPSTPSSSWPAAATTSPPRPPRWASGSPPPPTSCWSRTRGSTS